METVPGKVIGTKTDAVGRRDVGRLAFSFYNDDVFRSRARTPSFAEVELAHFSGLPIEFNMGGWLTLQHSSSTHLRLSEVNLGDSRRFPTWRQQTGSRATSDVIELTTAISWVITVGFRRGRVWNVYWASLYLFPVSDNRGMPLLRSKSVFRLKLRNGAS